MADDGWSGPTASRGSGRARGAAKALGKVVAAPLTKMPEIGLRASEAAGHCVGVRRQSRRAFVHTSHRAVNFLRPLMRLIGVLGGMSSASTSLYYSRLNAVARAKLGGLHGASLLLRSVDFAPIAAMQAAGEWQQAAVALNAEARVLERGGAELMLLATNTMHCVADEVTRGLTIPLLHIGDATASAISRDGLCRPGLMATAFTMEGSFYTDRLRHAGLDPLVPCAADRAITHRIIYEELCKDVVTAASRAAFERIAERLVARGADCLILGCTEIGMLLDASNVPCAVYDTTHVHCDAAIAAALAPSV